MRNLVLAAAAVLLLTTPAPSTPFLALQLFGLRVEMPIFPGNPLVSFDVRPEGQAVVCTPTQCYEVFADRFIRPALVPPQGEAMEVALLHGIAFADFGELEEMVKQAQANHLYTMYDVYMDGVLCVRVVNLDTRQDEQCTPIRFDTQA